jgi:hypothetical protein
MRLDSTVVIAVLLCGAFPSAAQDSAIPVPVAPAEQRWSRDLGGHTFVPSHIIDNPFSETAVTVTVGAGAGDALGPVVQRDPPAILTEGKWYGYTILAIGVGADFRILEYLSARAAFAAGAYMGSGQDSVLVVGANARLSGAAGVKGSLPVGDNLRFAATFDVVYGPVYTVLIAQGLVDGIQSGQITASEFLQTKDTVTWIGGLVGSWAPWPFLGLTLNSQFLAPTKTGNVSYAQNGVLVAGMADFDARPLLAWLPMGLNLAYAITSPVGGNGVSTLQEFGFGFYYTGRRDFALGLEIDWKIGRLENTQATQATLAWLNFKYYWN